MGDYGVVRDAEDRAWRTGGCVDWVPIEDNDRTFLFPRYFTG